MQITSNGLFPNEMWEFIISKCDLKSKSIILQVCKCFIRIMEQSQILEIKAILLSRAVFNINEQLKANSGGNNFILSDIPPKHPATTKIKFQELLDFCSSPEQYSQFEETIIDALCDLKTQGGFKSEGLTDLQINEFPANINFSYLVNKAKFRDKGDLFLFPNYCMVVGTQSVDYCNGWEHGDYGLGDGWHVAAQCWISSEKKGNWARSYYGIDDYLPVKLFLGKKEGDIVLFMHRDREIKLRCAQQKHKYKQDCFENLCLSMLNPLGTWDPKEGQPSRQDQRQMLNEMHEAYQKALNEQ